MIYLYAITESLDGSLDALRGIDDAPLGRLVCEGVGAVISTGASPSVAPTPERLWQHERVVEALMAQGAVLPARFSTTYPDEAAVMDHLADLHAQHRDALERLRGCVEFSVRVVRMIETPPLARGDGSINGCPELVPAQQNGRTYEVARQAARLQRLFRQRRNEGLGEMLNRCLVDYAVDHRLRIEQGVGMLVKAAYLVEEDRLPDIQHAVRRLTKTYPNLHFLCTGPWPPYSFVQPIASPQESPS